MPTYDVIVIGGGHNGLVDAKDPAFFSAFPDGRHFFMWQDRANWNFVARRGRQVRRSDSLQKASRRNLEGRGRHGQLRRAAARAGQEIKKGDRRIFRGGKCVCPLFLLHCQGLARESEFAA
jgi:hypothetical protein